MNLKAMLAEDKVTFALALVGATLLATGSHSAQDAHTLAMHAHLPISLASKLDRIIGMVNSGSSTIVQSLGGTPYP